MTTERHRGRGFTLLEVMVAVAIMALAVGVIAEIEGHAIEKTNDTKCYTVATLLLRGKILDVQQTLAEEGFGDFVKLLEGDFSEEGFPDFRWAARVRKLEVPIPTSAGGEQANQAVEGSGGLSLATLAPMLQNVGSVLENAVRELEVRVLWMDGKYERHVSVVTHVVSREALAAGMLNAGLSTTGSSLLPTSSTGKNNLGWPPTGQSPGQQTDNSNKRRAPSAAPRGNR
ncbi:MAG: prepilin-type N-terminal cleavage/methylation domain-containing protein [Deltaproteobacteria bacterium]|nr:prepilin-type N-terminal cleavage/methylation domain-containing protein [Deltaproteobacteria bacterium]